MGSGMASPFSTFIRLRRPRAYGLKLTLRIAIGKYSFLSWQERGRDTALLEALRHPRPKKGTRREGVD